MTREIKFRAWDKRVQHMFTQVGEINFGDGSLMAHGAFRVRFEDVELTQFTGLKDKNGKEIYEGDIVKVDKKYNHYFPVNDLENDFNVVVRFLESSFYPLNLVGETVEVIGNIYENRS